jgi:Piwi domain
MYRDGVGKSQFAMVQDQEVPAIKAAIAYLYDDLYRGGNDDGDTKHPLYLVISTVKRHHARFFPIDD